MFGSRACISFSKSALVTVVWQGEVDGGWHTPSMVMTLAVSGTCASLVSIAGFGSPMPGMREACGIVCAPGAGLGAGGAACASKDALVMARKAATANRHKQRERIQKLLRGNSKPMIVARLGCRGTRRGRGIAAQYDTVPVAVWKI